MKVSLMKQPRVVHLDVSTNTCFKQKLWIFGNFKIQFDYNSHGLTLFRINFPFKNILDWTKPFVLVHWNQMWKLTKYVLKLNTWAQFWDTISTVFYSILLYDAEANIIHFNSPHIFDKLIITRSLDYLVTHFLTDLQADSKCVDVVSW